MGIGLGYPRASFGNFQFSEGMGTGPHAYIRATHARLLRLKALASVPCEILLVRVRVSQHPRRPVSLKPGRASGNGEQGHNEQRDRGPSIKRGTGKVNERKEETRASDPDPSEPSRRAAEVRVVALRKSPPCAATG